MRAWFAGVMIQLLVLCLGELIDGSLKVTEIILLKINEFK